MSPLPAVAAWSGAAQPGAVHLPRAAGRPDLPPATVGGHGAPPTPVRERATPPAQPALPGALPSQWATRASRHGERRLFRLRSGGGRHCVDHGQGKTHGERRGSRSQLPDAVPDAERGRAPAAAERLLAAPLLQPASLQRRRPPGALHRGPGAGGPTPVLPALRGRTSEAPQGCVGEAEGGLRVLPAADPGPRRPLRAARGGRRRGACAALPRAGARAGEGGGEGKEEGGREGGACLPGFGPPCGLPQALPPSTPTWIR